VNRLKVFATCVVVATLLDSSLLVSASLMQGHHSQGTQSIGVNLVLQITTPLGEWNFAGGQYLSANMTTRGEIMAYILTNPGVYMREVSEDLGLSMGVVQYHIWVLTKNGEIEECRTGRYRRFFGAARYEEMERKVISLLRQGTAGKIISILAEGPPLTHMELAELLGVTSQALTWQMRRLRGMGMVETGVFQGQMRSAYRLVDGIAQKARDSASPIPKLVQVQNLH